MGSRKVLVGIVAALIGLLVALRLAAENELRSRNWKFE